MKKIYRYAEIDELVKDLKIWRSYDYPVVMTGGYFNVLHLGHIELLKNCYKYAEHTVIAVNSDEANIRKNGYSFLPWEQRAGIIAELPYVRYVIENPNDSMEELLRILPVTIYCKGGDVKEENLLQSEKDICANKPIQICYNVGGGKIASSSDFLRAHQEYCIDKFWDNYRYDMNERDR